ncbi:MAG: hypothetical protein LBM13_05770 [Candidatus Ancillula sp.]|jgi:hypothetical protein|nr:hypothetical protein [Candidatus Ancillula sp.]
MKCKVKFSSEDLNKIEELIAEVKENNELIKKLLTSSENGNTDDIPSSPIETKPVHFSDDESESERHSEDQTFNLPGTVSGDEVIYQSQKMEYKEFLKKGRNGKVYADSTIVNYISWLEKYSEVTGIEKSAFYIKDYYEFESAFAMAKNYYKYQGWELNGNAAFSNASKRYLEFLRSENITTSTLPEPKKHPKHHITDGQCDCAIKWAKASIYERMNIDSAIEQCVNECGMNRHSALIYIETYRNLNVGRFYDNKSPRVDHVARICNAIIKDSNEGKRQVVIKGLKEGLRDYYKNSKPQDYDGIKALKREYEIDEEESLGIRMH